MSSPRYRLVFLVLSLFCLVFASFSAAAAQEADPAEVGIFTDIEMAPGARVEIPIEVRGVEALYAADLTLSFDPAIIQVEDANPNQDGVQLALGTFLDAGLVLFNTADNDSGTIRFAMTQVNPSEGKSGDGILLVLYARAASEGQSEVEVTAVELANRMGESIPASGVGASVVVSAEIEEVENTPIPVQDPTLAIQVPTPEPTFTPTSEPTPEPSSTPMQSNPADQAADTASPEENESESSTETREAEANESSSQADPGFSLLRYWWAVVILALLVVGLAVYLFVIRK